MRFRGAGGFQLLELVIVLAVAAILITMTVPGLLRLAAGLRVQMAARELAGALRQARAEAVRHNVRVGVKFEVDEDGPTSFALYRDADGDGVLTSDIESGVDPRMGPARDLVHMGRDVDFGFPPGPPPRDPGDPRRRLDRLEDPIRFNRSDLASFGPLGGSTPGSLYVTDHVYHLAVVRLFGRTGKTQVLTYDPETETWH